MINKRYLAVAGMLVLAVAAAGCGKKSDPQQQTVQATPTPATDDSTTPTPTVELVDMEQTEEKNIMGEKTSTASKLTITNQTGSEVKAIYIRQHPSDDEEDSESDEWGDDLVGGMFTLKNGDSAVYYYEKPSSSSTYDIRITYTDEEKSECFFRDLPLTDMKKITLKMDGKDEEAIPYATYTTATGSSEVSTLNDVKKRLGLDTDDSSSDSSSDSSADPTSTPSSDDSADPTSAPSSDDSDNNNNNGDNNNSNNNSNNNNSNNDTEPTDNTIQTAEQYIGRSVDDLIGAVGDAQSSEWDNDDNTGTSGYYYYPNFTVSTSVDESGNEIVTGVW